jgi:hypothetical protein
VTETLWGLFPWFEECGADHVHPDDLAILRGLHPYGHLFKSLGTAEPYVRLLYSGGEVRVRPGLFTTVSAPVFDYGAMVRTLPPHTMRAGQVAMIMWHYRRQEPFYLLVIDGKKHATRYFAPDLVLAV